MGGPGDGRCHPSRELTWPETLLFCLMILLWPFSLVALWIMHILKKDRR